MRSSATAEDLPYASFAGAQDTFLNVTAEADLLDAIARCWASLHNERATAYREANNLADQTVRMAVVVQRMVDAAVAGVMFTANLGHRPPDRHQHRRRARSGHGGGGRHRGRRPLCPRRVGARGAWLP